MPYLGLDTNPVQCCRDLGARELSLLVCSVLHAYIFSVLSRLNSEKINQHRPVAHHMNDTIEQNSCITGIPFDSFVSLRPWTLNAANFRRLTASIGIQLVQLLHIRNRNKKDQVEREIQRILPFLVGCTDLLLHNQSGLNKGVDR